ncbi:hypothetical protein QBC44DRAFT_373418 [Cladorrhinum sp. PSN332]|nr:hypothetical protein QBC44DRAFT_373418 [Cladorrhinum sp. PSN332]
MKFTILTCLVAALASPISPVHAQDSAASEQPSSSAVAACEIPSSSAQSSTSTLVSSESPTRTTSESSKPSTTDSCSSGTETATPALVSVSMPFILPSDAVGGRIHAFTGSISLNWRRCGAPTQAA